MKFNKNDFSFVSIYLMWCLQNVEFIAGISRQILVWLQVIDGGVWNLSYMCSRCLEGEQWNICGSHLSIPGSSFVLLMCNGGELCHLAGTNTYHERSMISIQGYKWLATRSMLVISVKIDPIFTRQPFELQQNIPDTIIDPLPICTTPYW